MSQPELTLYATEMGREATEAPELALTPRADLADIRAWRFFDAAPDEFFAQYASGFLIDHVHVAFSAVDTATQLLAGGKIAAVRLAGHFGAARLALLKTLCQEKGIRLAIRRLPAPRALAMKDEATLFWRLPVEKALSAAGLKKAAAAAPAVSWAAWFNRFYADEVLPVLRPRSTAAFFGFMKTLSEASAQGLNWAGLGARCGLSGPSVRDWCRFLTDAGVIDLVAARKATPPRRAKLRPKLYWNAPGLAVWLSDAVTGADETLHHALLENAVYLALKDAHPGAAFVHFLDTNAVRAPLLMTEGDKSTAYYFPTDDASRQLAMKHQTSLLKAGIVTEPPVFVEEGAASDSSDGVRRLIVAASDC